MEKTIVSVLGMHRSGSSYVAGRIRGMGIDFGHDEELIAGDAYNELGYHENKDLSYLGEEILIALGGDHMRPPFLEPGWETSSLLDSFRAKAKLLVETKFGKSHAWGWKDPRTSLLIPFWRQIFQPTHYIIPIRNPLAVAESLLRRNGIAIRHGSELWFLHMASAIFHTRGFKRKFVFFENASQSPLQFDRELAEFLSIDDAASGAAAGPEFADTLVHHKQTDEQVYANEDIHSLAKALYRELCELHFLERNEPNTLSASPRKDENLLIFKMVETEPSLVINSSTLPNCLSHKSKISDSTVAQYNEEIGRLNQIIGERNEQIAKLHQAMVVRDAQITDLSKVVAERDQHIVSLNRDLSAILTGRSWRLTRPFRFLFRTARNASVGDEEKAKLLLLCRALYRKAPLPFKTKYKLRGVVLRITNWPTTATSAQTSGSNGSLTLIPPDISSGYPEGGTERQNKPYFGVRRPHGKRRAAILTNQLLDWNSGKPRFGGGERYALELGHLLRELSIEVTFFQPSLLNKTSSEYYSFEVRFLPIGKTVGEFHYSVCTDFTEITADFDHVYYHLPEYASGVVREDGLMVCHGIWFDHNNYPDAIFRTASWFEYLYRSFSNPIGVISVDTNSIGVIRSLWPDLARKMHYIPNFFDKKSYFPDFNKRNTDRLTVLFPRRSQINRGSRIFADIVSSVPYDVEIIWLGEGDPVDTQIIKDVSASDKRVSFSVADFDEMPLWYQRADIAVIPTIACEGTSLSCIEALACGCAVIATNVGGLPDVIYHGINGLLVEPNPSDISGAINKLIEDRALREKLQRAGAETAHNFELTLWRARWVELLWDYGWINGQSKNNWLARNPADTFRSNSRKADKWVILTRNAIHGGVESIIREESRLLNASVVVCGGHDNRETCPFEYSRADNSRALEKAIVGFDVILYHWLPEWALDVIKRSKKISIEFIHRVDTSNSDKTVPTILVTHSTFLANYIYDSYGRPCRVLDHPIPLDRFVPAEDLGNCIGAITSYYEIKGIDIFLRAWAILKEEFGHMPVRFYGAGDDLHKFKQLASELDIDVDFRAATPEPWKAMKEFGCFVVPSRLEGLPVAVLEALAMDVPVIAAALPGMVEFNELSVKRGYESYIHLAAPENPEDLAQTIRAVLLDKKRKTSNAYISEYYSPNKHCSDLVDLLRELCPH